MLQPGDAALVERDPAIPGLAALLDPDACPRALQLAFPEGPDIVTAAPRYVRYKAGTSCLAALQVVLKDREVHAYAVAWRRDAEDKLSRASKRDIVPGPLGPGVAMVPGMAMTVQVFPNDHELTSLPLLADDAVRARLIAAGAPDHADLAAAPLETLRYKPERRFVGRVMPSPERGLVLRCYDDPGYERAVSAARAIRAAAVPCPALLGAVDRRRTVLWEWAPGRSAAEALDAGDVGLAANSSALALTCLHRASVNLARAFSPAQVAAETLGSAHDLSDLDPALGEEASILCERLAAPLRALDPDLCPCHGDFSPEHVIIAAEAAPSLLDFDRSALGHRAYDAGSFLAVLHQAEVTGRLAAADGELARRDFLRAYQAAAGHDLAPSAWLFAAAALVRRLAEPFRARAPAWPARARRMLARAQELAACSGN